MLICDLYLKKYENLEFFKFMRAVLQYRLIFSFQFTISCVLHCAALKSVKESWDIPLSYYSNNVTGSINLFTVSAVTNPISISYPVDIKKLII